MTHDHWSRERVLVVPRADLDAKVGAFQGYRPDAGPILDLLAERHGTFLPRSEAEHDPSFKQIIPYVVFTSGDSVFCYTRGSSQGEARLHAKRSLGVGGHVDEADADGRSTRDAYEVAVRREIAEEVEVGSPGELSCVGLINDDATPVGQVHLGLVHLYRLDRPDVVPKEGGLAEAGFVPLARLRDDWGRFESWSQLCIDALLDVLR